MPEGDANGRPQSFITSEPLEPDAEVVVDASTGTVLRRYRHAGLTTIVAIPTGRFDDGFVAFSELPRTGHHGFDRPSIIELGGRQFGVSNHGLPTAQVEKLAASSELRALL